VTVTAIIQARLGSTRLPGKVLTDIAGQPMLGRILQRVAAADSIDAVVVATTDAPEDDRICDYVLGNSPHAVFRGSQLDVLDRYYECARLHGADVVVRVTADDPLKDPGIIDAAVALLKADVDLDYCSNTIEPTFPEGLDVEVFRFRALEQAHREASLPSEREHVTPYLYKHPELFRVRNFRMDRNLSDWRWTVDEQVDIDFMTAVYSHFKSQPLVAYAEVIDWLAKNPSVQLLNADVARRAGYQKSLAAEQGNPI
jgi:spore coat polysaccharide biosynthesis protein SpsF